MTRDSAASDVQDAERLVIRLTDESRFEVSLGDEKRFGDLYYLGLDSGEGEPEVRPEVGLRRLLQSWIDVIAEAEDGARLCLPFDFSDETTRWIHCRRVSSDLHAYFGWAPVEGWSFSPTDFRRYLSGPPGFQPDEHGAVHRIYIPCFLAGIRSAMASLA